MYISVDMTLAQFTDQLLCVRNQYDECLASEKIEVLYLLISIAKDLDSSYVLKYDGSLEELLNKSTLVEDLKCLFDKTSKSKQTKIINMFNPQPDSLDAIIFETEDSEAKLREHIEARRAAMNAANTNCQ